MQEQFIRTSFMFGDSAMEVLENSHVAVFGIGGVGGYVCEALARAGVGSFTLIDKDDVSVSNINRQIIATLDTIGMKKVDVMKDRILSINRNAKVEVVKCFFLPENQDEFDFSKFDYVIDAVDTVTAKICLVMKAKRENVKIISSMGTGNKLNPMAFKVADIFKTKMDPLAKVMRKELKARGVDSLKVIYSEEEPKKPLKNINELKDINLSLRKDTPASNSFVPPAAGLLIASEVIKDLINVQ